MKMKIIIGLLLLIMIAGCSQESVKIGFVGPLSGPVANPGIDIKQGFELGIKDIEVFYEDGKCIPKEALTAAQKLIEVHDVDILISSICGGSTLTIASATHDKILLTPVSTAPSISSAGEHVFRISSSAELFAEKTAEMINVKRLGIIFEESDYAVGWKNSFIEKFQGEIIEESFLSGSKDAKTQLMKLKEVDSILMIVQSPMSAVMLVKQAKELGLEQELIGNEAFFSRGIVKGLMGEAAEGLKILTYKYDIDSTKMKDFIMKSEKKFGKAPSEEMYGALGYDLGVLVNLGVEKCGKDIVCLKEFIGNTQMDGAAGSFKIEDRTAQREFMWWTVKEGNIIPV